MISIGVFSDSAGDLSLFHAALALLRSRGAERFFFAGGGYADADAWLKRQRDALRESADYTNEHFLEDVTRHLLGLDGLPRPAAFGAAFELAQRAEEAAQTVERIVRTPERGSGAHKDPSVPRKLLDMLGDTICCLVHDKNELEREDLLNAGVLIHGNSPEPKVVQIGPRAFVTPGRLVGGAGKPTVGLFQVQDRQISFSAYSLDGEAVLEPQPIVTGTKTRLSVK